MLFGALAGKRSALVAKSILIGCLGLLLFAGSVDAKSKKLDNRITKIAEDLAKDRELAFSGGKSMPLADFQQRWTAFAKQLDDEYAGYEIALKTFGTDVKQRNVFTHVMYMAFRVQQKSPLSPMPQEVVARHPFLQELMVEGSCYTGGDPYPKKIKDLLRANPDVLLVLRDHIEKWDGDFRKKFEREYASNNGK